MVHRKKKKEKPKSLSALLHERPKTPSVGGVTIDSFLGTDVAIAVCFTQAGHNQDGASHQDGRITILLLDHSAINFEGDLITSSICGRWGSGEIGRASCRERV